MAIYITGDTHGGAGYNGISDFSKLNTRQFPEQLNLSRNDYLIICGDFGAVFHGGNRDRYWLNWLEDKNFTTLFVDGNHENFDLLEKYETIEKFNGKVHKIREHVFHLQRGQMYSIQGKRVFTMGGALSQDRRILKDGSKSWWDAELPSQAELDFGILNLEKSNFKVDLIITHDAPSSIVKQINSKYSTNYLTEYLEYLRRIVDFDSWYFGHYHLDKSFESGKFNCVYQSIIKYI